MLSKASFKVEIELLICFLEKGWLLSFLVILDFKILFLGFDCYFCLCFDYFYWDRLMNESFCLLIVLYIFFRGEIISKTGLLEDRGFSSIYSFAKVILRGVILEVL